MSPKITAKELKSDLMLYNSDEDSIHILNETARYIYGLCKEEKSLNEIEGAVREKFHLADTENVHDDLMQCIEELRKKELIN